MMVACHTAVVGHNLLEQQLAGKLAGSSHVLHRGAVPEPGFHISSRHIHAHSSAGVVLLGNIAQAAHTQDHGADHNCNSPGNEVGP